MNATYTNAKENFETVKVSIRNWMFIIISYFIYIFNYQRWATYIDNLIKKYNAKSTTTQESCAERLRAWTKEKNDTRTKFVNDFWNRYKDIDYTKINLAEGKIPNNFNPVTLNEVAAKLLPEEKDFHKKNE